MDPSSDAMPEAMDEVLIIISESFCHDDVGVFTRSSWLDKIDTIQLTLEDEIV